MSYFLPLIVLGLIFLLPQDVRAQGWFTREACTVTAPAIDPTVLPPIQLAAVDRAAARIENGTGRLWRVETPSGKVSHLWGTMHSTDALILDLPGVFRDVLANARVVATEVDPVFSSRARFETYRSGRDQYEEYPLPDPYGFLDPRVKDWITARLNGLGYGEEWIDWLKPGSLAALLLFDPCDDFTAGTYPIQDNRIRLLARENGAALASLEPIEALHQKLDGREGQDIAHAVIEYFGSLLAPGAIRETRRTYFALYLSGEIGRMMAWDREATRDFFGNDKGEDIYRRMHGYLVDESNRGFVRRALPLIDEGGAVLAVGAFHLPGREGLVSLLRNKGLTVERIAVVGEVP